MENGYGLFFKPDKKKFLRTFLFRFLRGHGLGRKACRGPVQFVCIIRSFLTLAIYKLIPIQAIPECKYYETQSVGLESEPFSLIISLNSVFSPSVSGQIISTIK